MNFIKAEEYIPQSSRYRRSINPNNLCEYGIDFLDEHLGGIHNKELILLGAESGKGKTTLVSEICIHNSMKGRKIAFFRLEGDIYEFADTEKWKFIYNKIKEDHRYHRHQMPDNLNYMNFRLNKIKGIESYEDLAEKEVYKKIKNVYLYTKKSGLNKRNFSDKILEVKDEVDLIVIDHFHYFDFFEDQNELMQQRDIMKAINSVVENYSKPIILVVHVRKRQSKRGLIGQEDIYGSSDIYKIAHTIVFTSPFYQGYDNEKRLYPTLFYTPKSRSGASTNRIGQKVFDGLSKTYQDGFKLFSYDLTSEGEWGLNEIEQKKDPENNFQ